MRHILLGLAVFGAWTMCGPQAGYAQQKPRRSVTYVFQQVSVAKTQWSPDTMNSTSSATNAVSANNATAPGLLTSPAQGVAFNQADTSSTVDASNSASHSGQRPNVQQMQNPSGGYNFSPSGTSQGQQMTANNYLGAQFNNWNNLRVQPNTLDAFQAFNRTQPPAPVLSGAYVSPNNYFGPAFSQWNNLSSGSVSPNYLGGYIYQQ